MQDGSWGNPYAKLSQRPIVDQIEKNQLEKPNFTEFTYEGWTIVFLEREPFTWYVKHNCAPATENATETVGVGYSSNQSKALHYDRADEEMPPVSAEKLTDIACHTCHAALPAHTYLILRRTHKFMLIGKRTFKQKYGED